MAEESVSLKEYLEAKLDALDNKLNATAKEAKDAVQSALSAQKEAVLKAEVSNENRFASVNEFRNTLSDQQRNLMPRTEAEILFRTINEKIDALNLTTITRQSKDTGQKEGIAVVALVAGLVSTLVVILSRFIK